MRRVAIVGCSGSGKSTLARRVAARLGAEHVELDSIFHQPGWTPLPADEFRARVAARLAAPSWVVDGNYSAVQDLVLAAADTALWIDLPRILVMRQVIARTLRRVVRREELWNGNRERWSNLFDPRPEQNIIMWSFTRHGRYRRTYAAKCGDPAHAHVVWHRLRSRDEMDAFVAGIGAGAEAAPGPAPDQVCQSRG